MTDTKEEIQKQWDEGVEVTRIVGKRHHCKFDGGNETVLSYCNYCGDAFTRKAPDGVLYCAGCGEVQ